MLKLPAVNRYVDQHYKLCCHNHDCFYIVKNDKERINIIIIKLNGKFF